MASAAAPRCGEPVPHIATLCLLQRRRLCTRPARAAREVARGRGRRRTRPYQFLLHVRCWCIWLLLQAWYRWQRGPRAPRLCPAVCGRVSGASCHLLRRVHEQFAVGQYAGSMLLLLLPARRALPDGLQRCFGEASRQSAADRYRGGAGKGRSLAAGMCNSRGADRSGKRDHRGAAVPPTKPRPFAQAAQASQNRSWGATPADGWHRGPPEPRDKTRTSPARFAAPEPAAPF